MADTPADQVAAPEETAPAQPEQPVAVEEHAESMPVCVDGEPMPPRYSINKSQVTLPSNGGSHEHGGILEKFSDGAVAWTPTSYVGETQEFRSVDELKASLP